VPVAFLLVIGLIAAGCGSGSGSDSTASSGETASTTTPATSPIGKAEFIKKADAACAKGKKQVETEFAAYLKKNKIKEIPEAKEAKAQAAGREAEVIETIALPALQQQVDEIRALGFPDGEEDQVEPFLDAVEEGIEKIEEDPQAFFSGADEVFGKADKLAVKYGLKVCGNR
jgi:hypothetical protein